jgi:hypothetical protein
MSEDTIRDLEVPGVDDVERFAEFRTALVQRFCLSDEHATRLAFALSERYPTLSADDLTSTHVDGLLGELAQDKKFEAELRAKSGAKN